MSDNNPWQYPYEGVWAMRFQAKTGYDMDRTPDAEELYQAFKKRLMAELVAQNPATVSGEHFSVAPVNYPLVDRS